MLGLRRKNPSRFHLTKLYAKNTSQASPSAWWAVRELPGAAVCQIQYRHPYQGKIDGWGVLLVSEKLGAKLPWSDQDIQQLQKQAIWGEEVVGQCPAHIRRSLEVISSTGNQLFSTRREALEALEIATQIWDEQS